MHINPDHLDESVTGWFHALKSGDEVAAHNLWHRYFQRLTEYAVRSLDQKVLYDEDDLAVSVFDSLFAAVKEGRYNELANRDELWLLLVTIARNKTIDQHRYETRQKRRPENGELLTDSAGIVEDPQASPDWSVIFADEFERLLDSLGNEELREIALLRFEGHTIAEIAEARQCGTATVKRKLAMIRKIWEASSQIG